MKMTFFYFAKDNPTQIVKIQGGPGILFDPDIKAQAYSGIIAESEEELKQTILETILAAKNPQELHPPCILEIDPKAKFAGEEYADGFLGVDATRH